MLAAQREVDLEVFDRYSGLSLPRHVSYPMPTGWGDVEPAEAASMLEESSRRNDTADLSLYLHIPFCQALCKFCACNKIILRKSAGGAEERVGGYVAALEKEIDRLARTIGSRRRLCHVHWGGGSPTYLSDAVIQQLDQKIRDVFTVSADAEVAMEIDPRTVSPERLGNLRGLGFNRVSLGVQDFDEQVQEHIHRVQPFEMVADTVAACRELGFDSVNFDLIYGLPFQTAQTVRSTLEKVIELSPDRIAYYHYAQIPEKIATQRGMDNTRLPNSRAKLDMFLSGVELFTQAGYEFVGLDHFSKPGEGLARSLQDGTIQRNFQGMSTGGGLDLIGVGVSAISHLSDVGFLQNVRDEGTYVERINEGRMPVARGKRLSDDDRIRQALINDLYCAGRIQPQRIEQRFGIDFADYFSREMKIMVELERDGLVALDGAQADGSIRATMPLGRVLLRTIAAVFDTYLDPDAWRVGDRRCFSANA